MMEHKTSSAPRLTIAMTTYNRAGFIREALQSALSQKERDIEILVVDDGSTDDTEEIVRSMADPRVRYLRKEHGGGADTKNRCIEEARAGFILWLDSDDILMPDVLGYYLEAIEQEPWVDVWYGDLEIFGDQVETRVLRHRDFGGEILPPHALVRGDPLPDPGSAVRKSIYARIGGFDTSFTRAYDYDFWCRAAGQIRCKHLGRVVYRWRWHDANESAGSVKRDTSHEIRIIRDLAERFGLRKLFPELDWSDRAAAERSARATLSRILQQWKAIGNSDVHPARKTQGTLSRKVLLVVHGFPPYGNAGTETYTQHFMQALSEQGIDVSVLYPVVEHGREAPEVDRVETASGVQWQILVGEKASLEGTWRKAEVEKLFDGILAAERYDIVHFQHTHWYFPFSLIERAAMSGAGVAVTLHDSWFMCPRAHLYITEKDELCSGPESVSKCASCIAPMLKSGERAVDSGVLEREIGQRNTMAKRALKKADIVSAPSAYLAEAYRRFNFVDDYVVSPLGLRPIDIGRDRRLNGPIRFVCIGAFHKLKNTVFLAESFKATRGSATLEFWGGGQDETIQELRAVIAGDDRMSYRGAYRQEDLGAILERADIAVIPSRIESYSLSVREALAAGVPVLASRVGGIPEIVREGVNGLLFDPQDRTGVTGLLQTFIDEPERLLEFDVRSVPVRTIEEDAAKWIKRYFGPGPARVQAPNDSHSDCIEEEGTSINTSETGPEEYARWIDRVALNEGDAHILAERMMLKWTKRPAIHLITVLMPGREHLLAETLASLQQQLYHGWGLTVISDVPAPDPAFESVEMLEWVVTDAEPAEAVWQVVESSPGEWVGLIEAGDSFEPDWLFEQVSGINVRPEWKFIYCDEDSIDERGERSDPRFKPDFDPDLLCSMPYVGVGCLVEKAALLQAGGVDMRAGLWNHDLAFRVFEMHGADSVGHVPRVLAHRLMDNARRYPPEDIQCAAMQMVEGHLRRTGAEARVQAGLTETSCFIEYLHTEQPLVSIIVPTCDRKDVLERCVSSLLQKTDYRNFELVIVDNGSSDPRMLCYLESMEVASDRVRVLRCMHEHNASSVNNFAVRHARGEYLLFLDGETQVVQERWLERMMCLAQRDEVGVVGARLVLPDQRVQHAGVIVGMNEAADHAHVGLPMADPGYMGRAQVAQQFSAVTGACLLVRRSVYEQVGGLDEEAFPVLYNDVDLCLRVRQAGFRVLWTPFATLVHHGSASLRDEQPDHARIERNLASRREFQKKWIPLGWRDPAWNPNLDLSSRQPRLETELVAGWNPDIRDRQRALGVPYDEGGCGAYRIREPLEALHDAAVLQTATTPATCKGRLPGVGDIARLAPDTLLLQSFVLDGHLDALAAWREIFPDLFMVFELDDLKTDLPAGNPFAHTMPKDMETRLRRALACCDRMVVSTEPLAAAYGDFIEDIRVVPNRLSKARWEGVRSLRRQGRKPRVGWAGAQQHHGDLALLAEVVPALADEVEWVFFGMCPPTLRPYVHEFHEAVPLDAYPARLAALNLDLAVAPLEIHPFNEAKSHLRLLEYGFLGWPVVCTDIHPYQQAPVARVPNTPTAWIEAIRERVHDADAREREGDALREWVLARWMLEDHLDDWLAALSPGQSAAGQKRLAVG